MPVTHPTAPESLYFASAITATGRFAVSGVAIITCGTGTIGMVIARALLQHDLKGFMLFDLGLANATNAVNITDSSTQ